MSTAKKYKCCVLNCPHYANLNHFTPFPRDSALREKWLQAIPKTNWCVDHQSLICLRHFKVDEINNVQSAKKDVLILRNKFIIPSVFPLVYEGEPKRNYSPKYMFELAERDSYSAKSDPNDLIRTFDNLKSQFQDKLSSSIRKWHVSIMENKILFYRIALNGSTINLVVKCCVTVTSDLIVTVTLSGVLVDPLDLTRLLPVSGKVTRWTQLIQVLSEFAN